MLFLVAAKSTDTLYQGIVNIFSLLNEKDTLREVLQKTSLVLLRGDFINSIPLGEKKNILNVCGWHSSGRC